MPFYWILGQEPLQCRDHRAQICDKIGQNYPDYRRHDFVLKSVQDWQNLADAAVEWSDLFSSHHLIECKVQAKIPKEGLVFLKQWAAQAPTDLSFLWWIDKPEWVKAPEYQPLLKIGTIHWAKMIAAKDFGAWLKKEAKKKGLKLAQDALTCLLRYTEGNVLAAHQVIEKLRILKQGVITEEEVVRYLTCYGQATVFDLTDAMLAGNTEKTFKILTILINETVEPHLLLWAITREVRTIIDIATAVRSNVPLHVACESANVWQSRVAIYGQVVSLVSLPRLYTLLNQAQYIDRIIKGLDPGNPYEAIGQCLLTLDRWLNKDRCFVA